VPRILWSAEAVRILSTLPAPVQDDIISKTGLLAESPQMYPVRRRERYRGQRFIISFEWGVYYLDRSDNVVITIIGHAHRRSA